MITPLLIFIDHDWTPGIKLSGAVHPHISFTVGVVAVCYHLRWGFIKMCFFVYSIIAIYLFAKSFACASVIFISNNTSSGIFIAIVHI